MIFVLIAPFALVVLVVGLICLVTLRRCKRITSRQFWACLVVAGVLWALPLLPLFYYSTFTEGLYSAARDGNVAKAKTLLSLGADPNADCEFGYALEAAVSSGHEEVAKLLLDHGANPDLRTEGRGDYRSLVRMAGDNGDWDLVKQLKAAGAKP
jgi:energy-coupling factor transporter transmembrane protein EcfT